MVGAWLVVIALGATPGSASADTVIAEEAAEFSAAAFGDAVAWSRYLPERRRYALMIRTPKGVHRARVPLSGGPFDVDLAANRRGGLAVVYTRRCARSDCSFEVYRYDLGRRRERRLTRTDGVDELEPKLWRGRVAFLQRVGSRHRLVVKRRGRVRAVRLPRWTRRALITGFDLRGALVATTWERRYNTCSGIAPLGWELLVSREGRAPRVLDRDCEGGNTQEMDFPQLLPHGVAYRRLESVKASPYRPFLTRIGMDGFFRGSRALPDNVASLAVAEDAAYVVRHAEPQEPGQQERWALVALD